MLTWDKFFRDNKSLYEAICIAVATRRIMLSERQCPEDQLIFKAFNLCQPKDTKVVILGLEPHVSNNQADGLSFSVKEGSNLTAGLKHMFEELNSDLSILNTNGNLTSWARQGVLLLNIHLTVGEGDSGSHRDLGWEDLTDLALKELSGDGNKVFILWGTEAGSKSSLIDESKNLIIKGVSPSAPSFRKHFYGSKPFSKVNNYLMSKNLTPINWEIKNV